MLLLLCRVSCSCWCSGMPLKGHSITLSFWEFALWSTVKPVISGICIHCWVLEFKGSHKQRDSKNFKDKKITHIYMLFLKNFWIMLFIWAFELQNFPQWPWVHSWKRQYKLKRQYDSSKCPSAWQSANILRSLASRWPSWMTTLSISVCDYMNVHVLSLGNLE